MTQEKTTMREIVRGQSAALQDLMSVLADRGRRLFDKLPSGRPPTDDLQSLCELLLSSRGQASGIALAATVLEGYSRQDSAGRLRFFRMLLTRFGINAAAAVEAAQNYHAEPGSETLVPLLEVVEPRRQELFRRLNQAAEGTARLVAMRRELLTFLNDHPELKEVDSDFVHLFHSWFNRGFLELRRIDWNTPAAILDRIIRYEAVHEISDWDDLRRRIDPPDRRLYAFFHPSLPGEPLIFVEIALTEEIVGNISDILAVDRPVVEDDAIRTAIFYSISNCQKGLRGISFGNFLIKQVLDELKKDLPRLRTFVTLSPVPGFARWLKQQREARFDALHAALDTEGWPDKAAVREGFEPMLVAQAARYLTRARNGAGMPLDPVARFHLGNGARLERVNWPGDLSPTGLRNSHGVMVNYLYAPDDIEANHEAYANAGKVAASATVQKLAEAAGGPSKRTTT